MKPHSTATAFSTATACLNKNKLKLTTMPTQFMGIMHPNKKHTPAAFDNRHDKQSGKGDCHVKETQATVFQI